MRARICSALSCDMFARVVWLRLRRAQNRRLSIYPLPHALATHYFLRLTRARGKSSQREGNALFDDFWYFSSQKSTIKERFLYVSSRVVEGADPCLGDANTHAPHMCQFPYKIKPQVPSTAKRKSQMSFSLFLLQNQAQKKKLSKRKRRNKLSRSAERDKS